MKSSACGFQFYSETLGLAVSYDWKLGAKLIRGINISHDTGGSWGTRLDGSAPKWGELFLSRLRSRLFMSATPPFRSGFGGTEDSPRYPISFRLATAFAFSSILIQLGLLWWRRRHTQLAERGFDAQSKVSVIVDEDKPRSQASLRLEARIFQDSQSIF